VKRHHAHTEALELMDKNAEAAAVLARLLDGERNWPRFELWRYIRRLQTEDYDHVGLGPESTRATRIMEYVLDHSAWQTAGRLLAEGRRDPQTLRRASKESLQAMAKELPPQDAAAKMRMDDLYHLSERIASARRVAKTPVIDGETDDVCWQWNGQKPWFMRNSSMPFPFATDFAVAYDDNNLYIALRCGDQSQEDYDFYWKQRGEKATQYGFRTKDTPSVHIYLDLAGEQGGKTGRMKPYQIVPNVYGGLWERYKAVASYKTVWNADKNRWQSEMAIAWNKLRVDPEQAPYFRLNVVRYVRKQWHRHTGGWYASREWVRSHNAQKNDRGWLVLE
jgi:hypothetical protein